MRRSAVLSGLLLLGLGFTLVSREPHADPRLWKAFRLPRQQGWIFVHLEGSPAQIGFQHGYLLAPEIRDAVRVISTEMVHDEKKDWEFFRKTAREVLWPKTLPEYQEEMRGIVEGLHARSVDLDLDDIVALNGSLELPYYAKWLDSRKGSPAASGSVAEHCSAFAATGSYTRDGRIVIAHNNWSSYSSGERWNVIFDIAPAAGHRILMDGMAGMIHSGDDFGVNSAGILITETTIGRFNGFDPHGVPEFSRARQAMQYAASIDEFARIMRDGNNGGYANDWLVADRKTDEIASLELGLKNTLLERTKDGFFVSANYPIDPKLLKEETDYDPGDMSQSSNARRARWYELMDQYKGKIDVAAAKRFLADHYDTYEKKEDPDERTLDGHIDLSPRGSRAWQPPYGIAGAVQNKVADGTMAERMSFAAALGHACGMDFNAVRHLREHPEFDWQKSILRDMPGRAWTIFKAQ
ncbi:MAG: phospholipase B family protein [Acidobacteria bacterium]|nr:phospholipase B family protein [Acidobacteriota bacterium]